LHSSEYLDLFKAQAATFKTVYLVIDALDTRLYAPEENTQQNIRDALTTLPDSIRIIFTSRDSKTAKVGQGMVITPNLEDVKTYVRARIEKDVILNSVLATSQDREEVIIRVTNMTLSSGMLVRRL